MQKGFIVFSLNNKTALVTGEAAGMSRQNSRSNSRSFRAEMRDRRKHRFRPVIIGFILLSHGINWS
jgi:hypothetical protein